MLGEYGVPDDDPRWLETLENLLIYLRDNGVPGTYWSAGPRWGDYKLAVQPSDNYTVDRSQMSVLEKYTVTAGNESGIEERADISGSGLKVSCMGREITLKSEKPCEVSVWNLSGVLVHKVSVLQNSPVYLTLSPGFYMVEHVKIVVN